MTEKKRCQTCNHVERAHFVGVKLAPDEDACVALTTNGTPCRCKAWAPAAQPQNDRDTIEKRVAAFLLETPSPELRAPLGSHARRAR